MRSPHQILVKKVEDLSNKISGDIIGKMSSIEILITFCIADHFQKVPGEKFELLISLLDKVPFFRKLSALKFIIEKYYQGFFKKYPTLIKDIEELQKIRNMIAHSIPEPNSDEFSTPLSKIEYRKLGNIGIVNMEVKTYTLGEHNSNILKLKKTSASLKILMSLMIVE